MPETLREKATKKLKGPDANPSQLGDPISMKAETSDTVPTNEEAGAHHQPGDKSKGSDSSSLKKKNPDTDTPEQDNKVVKRDSKL